MPIPYSPPSVGAYTEAIESPSMMRSARGGAHGVFASACWEDDQCDRGKSIRIVITGPDLIYAFGLA